MAHCESCGKALKNAEQICWDCDISLSQYGDAPEKRLYPFSLGKTRRFSKVCPSCGVWFSPRNMYPRIHPKNVPWYRYQGSYTACPNCHTILETKYALLKSPILVWYYLFALLSKETLVLLIWPYIFIFAYMMYSIILSAYAIACYRSYKDEHSFIIKFLNKN